MRRWPAICTTALFVGVTAVLLGGCGTAATEPTTSPAASASSSPAADRVSGPAEVADPSPGMVQIGAFAVVSATTFSDGVVGIGAVPEADQMLPALLRPTGGTSWATDPIGDTYRLAEGAAEIGDRQVVVGHVPNDQASSAEPVTSFTAVSTGGGPWDSSTVYVDASTILYGVAAVSDGRSGEMFMAVGAHTYQASDTFGDPDTTFPLAIFSTDGASWQQTAPLPLPDKARGGQALSVLWAGDGTGYPGTIIAGIAWTDDADLGVRTFGVVWRSTDGGRSWDVVSDESFDETGSSIVPRYLASDGSTIAVAGSAGVPGQADGSGGALQSQSVVWTADANGDWYILEDAENLAATRSSLSTALTDRAGGGYLVASEEYKTAAGAMTSGARQTVEVQESLDGLSWTDVTSTIPDADTAVQIAGIAEFNDLDVFLGADGSGSGAVWVAAVGDVQ